MKVYYEIAEFLVAAWRLANGDARIPTSHGILDHALKKIVDQDQFPARFREKLTFADTRVGMRCLELPTILNCAQTSYLTSAPNPAYETVNVNVGTTQSQRILLELDIGIAEGKGIGQALAQAIRETEAEFFEDELLEVEPAPS